MKVWKRSLVIIVTLLIIMPLITFNNIKVVSKEVAQIAGSDNCKTCHFSLSLKWTKNSHYHKARELTTSNSGECEVCHSSKDERHSNSEGKHNKMLIPNSFEEANRACGQCHFNINKSNLKVEAPNINKLFWKNSNHGQSELACTQCHNMHQNKLNLQSNNFCLNCHGPGNAIAFLQDIKEHNTNQQCIVCHNPHKKSVAMSRFDQKYLHYPVAQSKCFDCHSTHRASSNKLTIESNNGLCYKCHSAKEYVFPRTSHAKAKGITGKGLCTNCHSPHSADVKDLLRKPVSQVCRSCHYDYQSHHFLGIKIDEKIGCITCHRPHGGVNKALLKVDSKKVCDLCH